MATDLPAYVDGDKVYGDHDTKDGGGIQAWMAAINKAADQLDGTDSDVVLSDPEIDGYTEAVTTIAASGTAQTLDIAAATIIDVTLTGNCVFTMPTPTDGKSFTVRVRTGAGGFSGTFTGVKWPAGTAPTITATAARMDRLAFEADGTNWYGSFIQNYTP